MRYLFILCFFVASIALCGGDSRQVILEDLQLAEQAETLWRSIPSESPAKFAARQLWPGELTMVESLRFGIPPADGIPMEELRRRVRRNIQRVERALAWKVPVQRLVLPKLPSALRLQGEYQVNEIVPADGQTEWRIGWNRKYLFFDVKVKDSAIFCDSSLIYNGDSIEFFIQSDPVLPVYREIIVNPEGRLFDAWHVSAPVSQWGFFRLKSRDERESSLKPETIRTGEGYRIILRVPWKELPGYTKGNAPEAGDEIRIMLIRTEKRKPNEIAVQYAMHPVVAGGHNLRTMAVCILEGKTSD